MAHNARIRTSGQWLAVLTIDPQEMEDFDQAQFEAINGDDGGTWAPSSAIIIGGSGMQVTGAFQVQNQTVLGTLTIDESGVFVTEPGNESHIGGELHIDSGGALVVSIGGTATFNGAIALDGGALVQSSIVLVGDEARLINQRRTVISVEADTDIHVDSSTWIWTATLSTNRTLTVLQTTASPGGGNLPSTGERLRIVLKTAGGGNSLSVKREGSAANIVALGADNDWADIEWNGSNWELSAYGGSATPGADA